MKFTLRVPVWLCFALVLVGQVFPQFNRRVSNVGTVAAPFLEIGIGARSLGMGEAFVAVANDISAIYWNPAGLVNLTRVESQFFHSPWLAGIRFDHAAVGIPIERVGSLGLFYTGVIMDDMLVRNVVYPEGTGEYFGANDLTLGVSMARRLTDRFAFGFNTKFIQEQIWHMSAVSFAVDVGVLFITKNRGIRVGMSISNFGQKMRLEGRDTHWNVDIDEEKEGNNDRIAAHLDTWDWPLPMLFRVGISKDIIQGERHYLTVAIDAVHPNDNLEYVNAGIEYTWLDMLSLRVGYSNLFLEDAQQGLSLGAGLKYQIKNQFVLKLDYVSRTFGVFENVTGYSLSLAF